MHPILFIYCLDSLIAEKCELICKNALPREKNKAKTKGWNSGSQTYNHPSFLVVEFKFVKLGMDPTRIQSWMQKVTTCTSRLHVEVANSHLVSPAFCGSRHLHSVGLLPFVWKNTCSKYVFKYNFERHTQMRATKFHHICRYVVRAMSLFRIKFVDNSIDFS